ncbi:MULTISPECIES: hypothetical protein [unclassified Arthrobacter]|uniref:hypothetical protein n=1 Tax=unclassified Arthrobacter TaxID=235627 RepID=UPI001E4697EF|nr:MULTISPECIES: hypothetical protein [unclassified Arthrobacter]MCC9144101.1 hypothetical protein [Arthrobacter sp. zg-Y919]MDK1275326.1 hypothetical protein [Arthrobacter sp. zg.Y919]WIB03282.1 hypothetical protein QNO10_00860 [Arthrobacter sp. zg-Y919]
MDRFRGYIAGLGTSSGTRLVVGHWLESPLGPFTDVMAEDATGVRTLLAPSEAPAEYVGGTYRFDRTVVTPVDAVLSRDALRVAAGPLRMEAVLGPVTFLGRVLEHVPAPLAVAPWWLKLINPVAGLLVPGVRTAGSAGGGRREFYGVRSIRSLAAATAAWDGADLGGLRPVEPPVQFGFSSVPAAPQIVAVTTTILP